MSSHSALHLCEDSLKYLKRFCKLQSNHENMTDRLKENQYVSGTLFGQGGGGGGGGGGVVWRGET